MYQKVNGANVGKTLENPTSYFPVKGVKKDPAQLLGPSGLSCPGKGDGIRYQTTGVRREKERTREREGIPIGGDLAMNGVHGTSQEY